MRNRCEEDTLNVCSMINILQSKVQRASPGAHVPSTCKSTQPHMTLNHHFTHSRDDIYRSTGASDNLRRTEVVIVEVRIEGEEADVRALAAGQAVQGALDRFACQRHHAAAHCARRDVEHEEERGRHRLPHLRE